METTERRSNNQHIKLQLRMESTAISEGEAPWGLAGGGERERQRWVRSHRAAAALWQSSGSPHGTKAANDADLIRDERSTELTETSPPDHHANGVMGHGVDGGLGGLGKPADR